MHGMRARAVVFILLPTEMRRYQRELGFVLVAFLVVGSIVSYFFHQLKREKSETAATVYSFVPPHPEALLRIQETNTWLKLIAGGERERRLFEEHIPVFFFHLFEEIPVHEVLFSFHAEGVVCLVKANPLEAKRLSATTQHLLDNYPPKKQVIGTTQLSYYTDGPQRFLGTFYREGIWVASYHKRLLEQAGQTTHSLPHFPAASSTVNLLFPYDKEWMQANIYKSEGRLSAFLRFPVDTFPNDSLQISLADTLQRRFCHRLHLPLDSVTVESTSDDDALYLTLRY